MEEVKGRCYQCNQVFSKRGMLKHLQSCTKKNESLNNKLKKKEGLYKLLKIESYYNKDYWLYIYIRSDCILLDLDIFLRAIWLECCGHLSSFKIDSINYDSNPSEYGFGEPSEDMYVDIQTVLHKDSHIQYEYDFGSTTELRLVVCDDVVHLDSDEHIILLARNDKPKIVCTRCHNNPSVYIARDYIYNIESETICESCVLEDDFDEGMMTLYVNSPRTGVCGYETEVESIEEIKSNMECIRKGLMSQMNPENVMDLYDEDLDDFEHELDYELEDEIEVFQELFNEFNEIMEKEDLKYRGKMYKNIPKPFTLKKALQRYSKEELMTCARFFDLKNYEYLKKAELAKLIVEQLPTELSASLEYVNTEVLELYEKIIRENGRIRIKGEKFFEADAGEMDYSETDLFQVGMTSQIYVYIENNANQEEMVGYMPSELVQQLKKLDLESYRENAKRNTNICEVVEALLELYGVITPYALLMELTEKGFDVDAYQLLRIVQYAMICDYSVYKSEMNIYASLDVNQPIHLLTMHNEFDSIPYKKVVLKGINITGIKQSAKAIKEVKAFEKFMKKTYNINKLNLEALMEEILYSIKEDPNIYEHYRELSENIDFVTYQEEEAFRKRFMNMAIHVPTWYLKGHSIEEADRLYHTELNIYIEEEPESGELYSLSTAKKVSRNDPCPCGSGRKYKHCCGK